MKMREENMLAANSEKDVSQIKIVWLLHFLWNIFSGWIIGTLLVVWYLFINDDVTKKTKEIIYDIINFNLTFLILLFISWMLTVILIWFLLLPIWYIAWFVFLVIWFIKHLAWEKYEYPITFTFLK